MMNEIGLERLRWAATHKATLLNLSNTDLITLPPELFRLTDLTKLSLNQNQLNKLPPEISKLRNLKELYLDENQLTTLPPEIGELKNLTQLVLWKNQLTTLPPEIGKLRNLTQLVLWKNQLTTLPPEIGKLRNLETLDLRDNQLANLPPELFKLTNLTELHLDLNRLTTLPPEIGKLKNLTELRLDVNRLTALPPELFKLTNLTKLVLWENQLTTLPPEIGKLRNLTELYLGSNQLTTLPSKICQLTKLEELSFENNPLTFPPLEIAEKGIKEICKYFDAVQAETQPAESIRNCKVNLQENSSLEQAAKPLNEVKILLVGDGAAGKTSLVKQLLGEKFDQHEDTTHGISIRDWNVKVGGQKIKVNIWDFGGQEIMHATHQFFLSMRSLYILVLDGRRDDKTEYWLRHIESFGGDSPVLVVLNKQDDNASFDVNRPFLFEKYKGIRQFSRTSCKTGAGIAEFKEALLEELVQVEMIAIRWPKSWFQVKQRIKRLKKPYIDCEKYEGICKAAGIKEEESRETLVDFLHDLGVAVHFKDYVLNAMHVLDPIWVTNAVYRIINARQVADTEGCLQLESLKDILRNGEGEKYSYPVHTHVYLLELMKKFELCWSLDKDAVLIPQVLPVTEVPLSFNRRDALGFIFHYPDFLPPSIFPRFMVKVHKNIKTALCWRTGMMLEDGGTEAMVKADIEARKITLWVHGPRRKEYLSFLWYSLREINSSFKKLTVSERVPMPDDPLVTADYQTLLDSVKDGIERCRPDGSKRSYNVKELLGLVQPNDKDELRKVIQELQAQLGEEESNTEVVNTLFELKPNIAGIGINLNELFARVLGREKQKRSKKR